MNQRREGKDFKHAQEGLDVSSRVPVFFPRVDISCQQEDQEGTIDIIMGWWKYTTRVRLAGGLAAGA